MVGTYPRDTLPHRTRMVRKVQHIGSVAVERGNQEIVVERDRLLGTGLEAGRMKTIAIQSRSFLVFCLLISIECLYTILV